ncbi:hypothetical protein AGMMS49940_01400 [Spirochaetia bacterium]|nr:hypothetical protein AGMMS49940_01400 [Spirochaetia bacterium]
MFKRAFVIENLYQFLYISFSKPILFGIECFFILSIIVLLYLIVINLFKVLMEIAKKFTVVLDKQGNTKISSTDNDSAKALNEILSFKELKIDPIIFSKKSSSFVSEKFLGILSKLRVSIFNPKIKGHRVRKLELPEGRKLDTFFIEQVKDLCIKEFQDFNFNFDLLKTKQTIEIFEGDDDDYDKKDLIDITIHETSNQNYILVAQVYSNKQYCSTWVEGKPFTFFDRILSAQKKKPSEPDAGLGT